MALKKTVAKLEDVPEALRGEYEKDGEVYRLKLEDADSDAPAALKGALEKERKARADAERKLRETVEQFKGIDPVKAREAEAKLQEIQDKKLIDEGKIEELLATRTERMKADHQAQLTAAQTRIKDLETKGAASETRLGEVLIDGVIKDVGIKGGVRKTLAQALVRIARAGDVEGIRWEIRDGNPVPVVGDAVKYGKDPSKPMSAEEYVALAREKMPDLFEPSNGTGTTPNTAGAGTGGAFTLTVEQARDVRTYQATKEAAAKVGQSVQIVG